MTGRFIFMRNPCRFQGFFVLLSSKQETIDMKQISIIALACIVLTLLSACGGKKKSEDIIAPKVEKVKPKPPVAMQEYTDERDVEWIGKIYHVAIHRHASDSLPMVKDEIGQKYKDNVFTLAVSRKDGSIFFSRSFTKKSLNSYLDDDFRNTGIFEGLVFDKVDGDWLVFAASVGHPQTDEYIPLVIRLSRMGELDIKRDVQMDTSNVDNENTENEDEV